MGPSQTESDKKIKFILPIYISSYLANQSLNFAEIWNVSFFYLYEYKDTLFLNFYSRERVLLAIWLDRTLFSISCGKRKGLKIILYIFTNQTLHKKTHTTKLHSLQETSYKTVSVFVKLLLSLNDICFLSDISPGPSKLIAKLLL